LRKPFAVIISVVVILGLFLPGCARKEEETVKVGAVLSLTGLSSTYGQSVRKGLELAAEEINKEGGVLGKQIECIIGDDESKIDGARTVITKLLMEDKVNLVIGGVTSSTTLAIAPLCQRYKVPLVTPSATSADVTKVGDYIFRACFIDDFQGSVLARFAFENLKARRAGILKDVKSNYSIGLASAFSKTFREKGGEIVNEQVYTVGDTDFRSQLKSIKASKPDVLFIPGYYAEVGLIIRQAKQLSIQAPLLGGDGWDSPRLLEIAGASAEGAYYGTHFSPQRKAPQVQKFVSAFKQKYNEEPDGVAALGYDALRLAVETISKAGTTEGAKVREQLAKTVNFPGITGNITIDENRNAKKPIIVLKIEGGKPVYLTSLEP